jgi:hypothetical protein
MARRKLLTAQECNEWLATLPPVPLWGEEKQAFPVAPKKKGK